MTFRKGEQVTVRLICHACAMQHLQRAEVVRRADVKLYRVHLTGWTCPGLASTFGPTPLIESHRIKSVSAVDLLAELVST